MLCERQVTAEEKNNLDKIIMTCIGRFQLFLAGIVSCGEMTGLIVVNTNFIRPLWSTTLVHILWWWGFWGTCENLQRHFRSQKRGKQSWPFLAVTFTNYLALVLEAGWRGMCGRGRKWAKFRRQCGQPSNLQALSFHWKHHKKSRTQHWGPSIRAGNWPTPPAS